MCDTVATENELLLLPVVSQNSLTLQNSETSQRSSSRGISGVAADAKSVPFFVFQRQDVNDDRRHRMVLKSA